MYSRSDILGWIQVAAWEHEKRESELKTTEYKDVDGGPTLATVFDRFEDWEAATEAAEEAIQQIPDAAGVYHQSIAALRRLYDLTGYPVTSLDYWEHGTEMPIAYHEIVGVHGTWTAAKRTVGIHDSADRWGGRDYSTLRSVAE